MRTLSLFLFIASIYSCNSKSNHLQGLDQLQGNWIAHLDQSTDFIETWSKDESSNLIGSGKIISKGKIIFKEDLSLRGKQGAIYYCARPTNQNNGKEICFRMKEIDTEETYSWTNTSHDFPQTISYTFIGKDSLIVLLNGIEKGKNKQEILRFRRQ